MRFLASLIVLFLFLPWCTACRPSGPSVTEREQMLMGTTVTISISDTAPEEANRAADLAFAEIRRIEGIMSTYIPESEISLINRSAGREWTSVDPELLFVIREGLRYGDLSSGAFDIAYKPLSRLWHFDPESRPPEAEAVRAVLPLVNYRNVLIDGKERVLLKDPGMAVGLGGIAKGYAVDRAVAVLQGQGIRNAIVNAGGDLRSVGRRSRKKMWRIGIQDPRDPGRLLEAISIADTAVATSGDYEKFFIWRGVRYHHILDPKTGFPARGCRSVTVICPTAMMADAMATAVFVLGPDEGMELIRKLPRLEGMIVNQEGHIIKSAGFRQEGIR